MGRWTILFKVLMCAWRSAAKSRGRERWGGMTSCAPRDPYSRLAESN